MRASDLLSALVINPTGTDYSGLYVEKNKVLNPIINIEKDGETIIFIPGEGTPERMSIIYKLLMLNKRCQLYKRVESEDQIIYGFKEVDGKIVL